MNWLRRIMYGRYGNDQLNIFLLVIYFILSLVYIITNTVYVWFASFIPIIISLMRMMSRNIYKRSAENQAFLKKWRPVGKFFSGRYARIKDRNHRYYKCSVCKAVLRVPKKAGKIVITCQACKNKITKNT